MAYRIYKIRIWGWGFPCQQIQMLIRAWGHGSRDARKELTFRVE